MHYTNHAKHERERPQALRLLAVCGHEGVSITALLGIQGLHPAALDDLFKPAA